MRKVVLYIAMSLDGYVADNNGGVDWLLGDGSDPTNAGTYEQFYNSIDTVILGYKTYHQIVTELSPDNWVYDDKDCYVLTHRDIASHDDICFTDETPSDLIKIVRDAEGKDIWICGGAAIAQQLLADDMIDEMRICVAPTILGGGVSLFGETKREFKLISTTTYNGFVELHYSRK